MKTIYTVILLIVMLLMAGCDMGPDQERNQMDPVRDVISLAEFETYQQQTDALISDLQKDLMRQRDTINDLTAKIIILESKIWHLDEDNVTYYNESYQFGLELPHDFLDHALIQTEEADDWTKVHFYYSDFVFEDGFMQPFFTVLITTPEQDVTCCGNALTPFMTLDDKVYYMLMPLDNMLPIEENAQYKAFSFSYPELLERIITK